MPDPTDPILYDPKRDGPPTQENVQALMDALHYDAERYGEKSPGVGFSRGIQMDDDLIGDDNDWSNISAGQIMAENSARERLEAERAAVAKRAENPASDEDFLARNTAVPYDETTRPGVPDPVTPAPGAAAPSDGNVDQAAHGVGVTDDPEAATGSKATAPQRPGRGEDVLVDNMAAVNVIIDSASAQWIKKSADLSDKIKALDDIVAEDPGGIRGQLAAAERDRLQSILDEETRKFDVLFGRYKSMLTDWHVKQDMKMKFAVAQNAAAGGQNSTTQPPAADKAASQRPAGGGSMSGSLFRRQKTSSSDLASDPLPKMPAEIERVVGRVDREGRATAFDQFDRQHQAVSAQAAQAAELSAIIWAGLEESEAGVELKNHFEQAAAASGVREDDIMQQVLGRAPTTPETQNLVAELSLEMQRAVKGSPGLAADCEKLDRIMSAMPAAVEGLGSALEAAATASGVQDLGARGAIEQSVRSAISAASSVNNPAKPDSVAKLAAEMEEMIRRIVDLIMRKLSRMFNFEYNPRTPRRMGPQAGPSSPTAGGPEPHIASPRLDPGRAQAPRADGLRQRIEPTLDAPGIDGTRPEPTGEARVTPAPGS